MRRFAAFAAALLVGAAAPLGVPGPAADASVVPMSSCSGSSNVTLAVNFAHWGGDIVRQCGTTPTTGFQLLNQGSFHTVGTQHDGPAFNCRISTAPSSPGYPTPQQDACSLTPPASAYWSYWHAAAGSNTWSYSNLGAMSYRPQPGSIDYWQFGGTNIAGTTGRPTVTPQQIRGVAGTTTKPAPHSSQHNGSDSSRAAGGAGIAGGGTTKHPSSSTGSRHTRSGTSSAGRAPSTAGSTGSSATKQTGSSSAGPATGTAAGAASGSASSSAAAAVSPGTAGSSGPTIVDARPASADTTRPSTGSVAPVLLGVTLAVLLAGGAGWTVWRRRRTAAG